MKRSPYQVLVVMCTYNVRVGERSPPSSHYTNTGSPGLVAPTYTALQDIRIFVFAKTQFGREHCIAVCYSSYHCSALVVLHNLCIWSVAGTGGLAIKRYRHIYIELGVRAQLLIMSMVDWMEL